MVHRESASGSSGHQPLSPLPPPGLTSCPLADSGGRCQLGRNGRIAMGKNRRGKTRIDAEGWQQQHGSRTKLASGARGGGAAAGAAPGKGKSGGKGASAAAAARGKGSGSGGHGGKGGGGKPPCGSYEWLCYGCGKQCVGVRPCGKCNREAPNRAWDPKFLLEGRTGGNKAVKQPKLESPAFHELQKELDYFRKLARKGGGRHGKGGFEAKAVGKGFGAWAMDADDDGFEEFLDPEIKETAELKDQRRKAQDLVVSRQAALKATIASEFPDEDEEPPDYVLAANVAVGHLQGRLSEAKEEVARLKDLWKKRQPMDGRIADQAKEVAEWERKAAANRAKIEERNAEETALQDKLHKCRLDREKLVETVQRQDAKAAEFQKELDKLRREDLDAREGEDDLDVDEPPQVRGCGGAMPAGFDVESVGIRCDMDAAWRKQMFEWVAAKAEFAEQLQEVLAKSAAARGDDVASVSAAAAAAGVVPKATAPKPPPPKRTA